MSIDVGDVGAEWLVVILATGVFVALIGGPFRDFGWRRGIEMELRIAERMRDLASSDDDVEAARRFASRVIGKADDLERRSSNLHAVRNLTFRFPVTLVLVALSACLMFYGIVWKGGDPANIPSTVLATFFCGVVLDMTRPRFFSRKGPDEASGDAGHEPDHGA